MKKMLKSKKGITLITLVITIIILIILAGISIAMLMGEDGVITKAKQGRQNMQNASIEEQEMLNALYGEMNSQLVTGSTTNSGSSINPGTTGGGLTAEEHAWLEAIYQNQLNGGGTGSSVNTSHPATLIGSYTGNQTIDVSTNLNEGDTVDNFIIEPVSISVWSNNNRSCSDTNNKNTGTATFSKSLDGNNLVISGTSAGTTSGNKYTSGGSTLTYKIWHI